MKPVVIIINGFSGSGKDTFVEFCQKECNQKEEVVSAISSVDLVKTAATILGWDGKKSDKDRDFLAKLKLLADYTYDSSTNYIMNRVYESSANVIFVHIREVNSIKHLICQLDLAGYKHKALFLGTERRNITVKCNDSDLGDYEYDYLVTNNGTLDELEQKAQLFMRKIFKEVVYGSC